MSGPQAADGLPALTATRLLLVVTGSAWATNIPFWVDWLRHHYPDLELTAVLTRNAQRFVTLQALHCRVSGKVLEDSWPEDEGQARHVALAEWAEAMLVYPATLHFMARLALGLADSPALLAAQCTPAPIAVAPALPPGGMESPAVQAHWAALAKRRNVVLVPPNPGLSLTTGRRDGWTPPPLPEVLKLLEERRAELAGTPPWHGGERATATAFLADRLVP